MHLCTTKRTAMECTFDHQFIRKKTETHQNKRSSLLRPLHMQHEYSVAMIDRCRICIAVV